MKRLKQLANAAILAPLAMPLALGLGLCWMFFTPSPTEEQKWGGALGLAIALYVLGIGTGVLFLVGASLHALLAVRTKSPCPWAWWFILVVSAISALVVRPIGTVAGAVVIILLFTVKPFRIMKNGVEPATPPYSEPAARSPQG